ncbi:hypothetical protein MTF65_07040 [Streptomyces sp. APSN-46.1]|uniref:hypothetical protein n=1 Tax=Streptomyces sp. APSN-46.1 TaxID=2929049 RepID=UPI001FB2E559|nr:hypothetical protein [Streptomyces sp. APSN-46.1]MCJ1677104.1 hypothetical protein [Streptomyces sp. APSN-46.1]
MTTTRIDGVDPAVRDQINLLALAWDVTPGEAVGRLLERFQQQGTPKPEAPASETPLAGVAVHALYAGVRVAGRYDPATENLSIPAGNPGSGHYKTPSGAATAVLLALKPHVSPNRNGWGFWVVDETGNLLQTLRRTKA